MTITKFLILKENEEFFIVCYFSASASALLKS